MSQRPSVKIYALFATVLLIQMVVYYYPELWLVGGSLRISTTLLRILVPILVNALVLKFSWKDLGIRWPKLSLRGWGGAALFALVLTLPVWFARLSPSTVEYYSRIQSGSDTSFSDRAFFWTTFTLTTLPAWEFLHRSFLLFGLKRILLQNGVKPDAAILRPLLIASVCTFEVIFHFQKPLNESIGMLLFSPLLSWIALRTESIVLPLIFHHVIEAAFFFAMAG